MMQSSANLGNRLGTRRSVSRLANARGPYRLSAQLRELAKRNSRAVRTFLSQHGERLAARVRRDDTNKLTTGRESPRSP
jgi:hypothetical protein